MSHPTRMRGLKSTRGAVTLRVMAVASYTDAWIEIFVFLKCFLQFGKVASYTDAWIEISVVVCFSIY